MGSRRNAVRKAPTMPTTPLVLKEGSNPLLNIHHSCLELLIWSTGLGLMLAISSTFGLSLAYEHTLNTLIPPVAEDTDRSINVVDC